MSRIKNALRRHYVAAWSKDAPDTVPTDLLRLAKWITNVTDDTDESSDPYADYAGDGTESTDVTGISEKWTFEGTYDKEDAAQALISGLKRKLGDERKVWHKIVQTDGTEVVGVATVSEIKAGSGDAQAYEEFHCVLNYDQIPTEAPASGA